MRSLFLLFLLTAPVLAETPGSTLPGHNIHLVIDEHGHHFWRGGSPKLETLKALQTSASLRHTSVTLIDLRHPSTSDDLTGKEGRLAPADEAKAAKRLGFHYRSISSLDPALVPVIDDALRRGDVYIHCMYGVNRTGIALGRYCVAHQEKLDRNGTEPRDFKHGEHLQQQLEAQPAK
jgi:hypothetical protein